MPQQVLLILSSYGDNASHTWKSNSLGLLSFHNKMPQMEQRLTHIDEKKL